MNSIITKISLEEAAELFGNKLFKSNGKGYDQWADFNNQQLVTIRTIDRKTKQPTKYLDLCYLKSGRGENIQVSTSGGGSVSEDVYGYLTTIIT